MTFNAANFAKEELFTDQEKQFSIHLEYLVADFTNAGTDQVLCVFRYKSDIPLRMEVVFQVNMAIQPLK